MIKSNVVMIKEIKACMHKLFYRKSKLLWSYSKASEQANIKEKEEIRAELIDKVETSYELEERIKEFNILPRNYKNEKIKEIKSFRDYIINYLKKKDNYISNHDAEILWQHEFRSIKMEVITSLIEIIKKEASILYKLDKVKGINDEIEVIKDLDSFTDKIEKFEIYIKNSNFFEENYKNTIVDMVYYIKKKPLEVLFN